MSSSTPPACTHHPKLRIDANNKISLQLPDGRWFEMLPGDSRQLPISVGESPGRQEDFDLEATAANIAILENLLNEGRLHLDSVVAVGDCRKRDKNAS